MFGNVEGCVMTECLAADFLSEKRVNGVSGLIVQSFTVFWRFLFLVEACLVSRQVVAGLEEATAEKAKEDRGRFVSVFALIMLM